jgi:hypothetical protein
MNRWCPPAKRRIIRSLTVPNIVIEPRNPNNAPTLYTDAPSDHPVLKAPHLGRYCMNWNTPSDEPLCIPSKRRIIRCWSKSLGASLLNLNATVGWTDGQGVGSSDAWAQTLDQNCSQTLRRRMNRCLHRRFIRRSILNQLAAELIRRVLKLGRQIIRRYELDFNSSNLAPLSFPSILLLQPCFHKLSELDRIQGTWVCIIYGFWVHGQATSVRTPLNSTVETTN